jgi:four helix bundle protein
LSAAVTAILARPAFQADRRLRDEIRPATDSVGSDISEGFPQSTDKAFAEYLVHAKASNAEIRTRLGFARELRYITDAELSTRDQLADEIARMLDRSDRVLASYQSPQSGPRARPGRRCLRMRLMTAD